MKASSSVVSQIGKDVAITKEDTAQKLKAQQEAELAEKARKVKVQRELREAASKVDEIIY